MNNEITFLLTGITFGLTAGLAPGPLFALVIAQTLRHNLREGVLVAIAPLTTDLPIILVTLFILSRLSRIEPILGCISIGGAAFILYMAYESITVDEVEMNVQDVKPQSMRKGVITNLLNPHPYLFWLAIGGPTVLKATHASVLSAVLFVAAFYVFIIGSKIVVALLIGRSRLFLRSKLYIYTIKALGIVLIMFAFIFLRDGLKFLGVL